MKNIIAIIACFVFVLGYQAQEKKIDFNKGTLHIKSSKNFKITGYDGNQVIIKSLSGKRNFTVTTSSSGTVVTGFKNNSGNSSTTVTGFKKPMKIGKLTNRTKSGTVTYKMSEDDKKKGLKRIGKENENKDLGIYFRIEKRSDGDLYFLDPTTNGQLVMYTDESYEVKIPNSIKLDWSTSSKGSWGTSGKAGQTIIYNSTPSSLSNFENEVNINASLGNLNLTDVTGPVSVNTIGGNVTITFDKTTPKELYSVYSNNGFIDITLPEKSSLSFDVTGAEVYSDLKVDIESEREINDFGHTKTKMKLKKGSGKVFMKLDAGYGNIYLRKKA